jgi:hypothetical protein
MSIVKWKEVAQVNCTNTGGAGVTLEFSLVLKIFLWVLE